jgi:glutathione-independent formaldehyde dehydrogenase
MGRNRGVAYTKPGEVEVQDISSPEFENPQGRKIGRGVILKVVSANIWGSDQHTVRGRTSAPPGMVLGHEISARTAAHEKHAWMLLGAPGRPVAGGI